MTKLSRWSVYLVRCSDGTYYGGVTTDLSRRIDQHNSGSGAKYTAGRRPVTLVWRQQYLSEGDAKSCEYKIKNWGRIKKEMLIAGKIQIE
jgi:putative endonuclease